MKYYNQYKEECYRESKHMPQTFKEGITREVKNVVKSFETLVYY